MGWRYRGVKINWDRRFDIFRLFAGEPDAVQQEGWRVDGHGPFDTLEETVDRLAAELAAEGWELVGLLPKTYSGEDQQVWPLERVITSFPVPLRKVGSFYAVFRQPWPDLSELHEAER